MHEHKIYRTMKKILITDDHDIVRLGTSIVIKEMFPTVDIDQAEDFEEMMLFLQKERYDLLMLDINMPGGNTVDMIEKILDAQDDLRILVFSSYEESLFALRYIEAGATGYVHKNMPKQDLKTAILSVAEDKKYMSPDVHSLYYETVLRGKSASIEKNPLNTLSNRELDVAQYIISGKSILEIAQILNLKNSTVSTYKTRLFDKLNVDNIPDLIQVFNIKKVINS